MLPSLLTVGEYGLILDMMECSILGNNGKGVPYRLSYLRGSKPKVTNNNPANNVFIQ